MIDWIKEIMCLLQTQITAYPEKQEHSQWRVGYETTLSLSLHQVWCSIFPTHEESETECCSYFLECIVLFG